MGPTNSQKLDEGELASATYAELHALARRVTLASTYIGFDKNDRRVLRELIQRIEIRPDD
jgi:hypothetical protein